MNSDAKPVVVIASYGGSGSTFLFEAVKQARPNALVFHTPAAPADGLLGIPVFNRVTGHAEGPFSKDIEMLKNALVVVVYRDPASAYASRARYKHFLHLWSDTKRLDVLFGSPPDQEQFAAAWRVAEERKEDLFGLLEYLKLWHAYAALGKHRIAFAKYEDLARNWEKLSSFLGMKDAEKVTAGGFAPRSREVRPKIRKIFELVQAELDGWPSFERFGQGLQDWSSSLPLSSVGLRGGAFTVIGLEAGAPDSILRMGLAFDAVTSVFDIPFIPPKVRNYHSPEVDFFKLFGISGGSGFGSGLRDIAAFGRTVRISLSEFIFRALHEKGSFQQETLYEVEADLYEQQFMKKTYPFPAVFNFRRTFLSHLAYDRTEAVFPENGSARVVLHLRRSDISGTAVFEGLTEGEAPARLRNGILLRPLLSKARAVQELERILPAGKAVEVVVAGDGFAEIRRRFSGYPAVEARIRSLEAEMEAPIASDKLTFTGERLLIGKDPRNTVLTLDAMASADMVVSASSTFPNVICKLGKVKLVHVKLSSAVQGDAQ